MTGSPVARSRVQRRPGGRNSWVHLQGEPTEAVHPCLYPVHSLSVPPIMPGTRTWQGSGHGRRGQRQRPDRRLRVPGNRVPALAVPPFASVRVAVRMLRIATGRVLPLAAVPPLLPVRAYLDNRCILRHPSDFPIDG